MGRLRPDVGRLEQVEGHRSGKVPGGRGEEPWDGTRSVLWAPSVSASGSAPRHTRTLVSGLGGLREVFDSL